MPFTRGTQLTFVLVVTCKRILICKQNNTYANSFNWWYISFVHFGSLMKGQVRGAQKPLVARFTTRRQIL